MKATAGLLALGLMMAATVRAEAPDIIPWQDADAYVGDERTVEGTVVAARREGNVLRLTFDPDPDSFSVALMATWFSPLPADPAGMYERRRIRATGKIRSFRGVSEMTIRDHSQLVIVTGAPEPTPIVRLEDRLENLERRIERIERRLGN
jgi:hypothetical protein